VERHEIETFLALAEELHFGRTAERLHVSQARVSQTIMKLERRIGAPLFARTTRRVDLTPIGQRLRDDLLPAHQHVQDAVANAVAIARGAAGILRVGFMGPVAAALIIDVRTAFRVRHPNCEIEIHETQLADPCEPLRNGKVDVLLTQLPVDEPGLAYGPVAIREARMLAVSARHPLAERKSVTLEDLAADKLFKPAGTPPEHWKDGHLPRRTPSGKPIEVGLGITTFQELLTLIAAGKGICPVAAHNIRYHPRPDVAYIPFEDAQPFEFGPVWRTAGETAEVRSFLKAVAEVVGAKGGPELTASASQDPR
jgi:DNA-binding transcriptional LysR family regulator